MNSDYIKLYEKKRVLETGTSSLKAKLNVESHDYAKKIDNLQAELAKVTIKLQEKTMESKVKKEELGKLQDEPDPVTSRMLMPLSRENLARFNASQK